MSLRSLSAMPAERISEPVPAPPGTPLVIKGANIRSLPDDFAVSVSSVTPAIAIPGGAGSRNKGKARANTRYEVAEGSCLVVGSQGSRCSATQSEYSPFCSLHSCQAFNEDGSKCCNKVADPTYSRICRSGFHRENGRYDELLHSLYHRQWVEVNESFRRKSEEEQCLALFLRRFGPHLPESIPSLASTTASSASSATTTSPTTPATSREASLDRDKRANLMARIGEWGWPKLQV